MRYRVHSASIHGSGKTGYWVEQYGSVVFRGGKKACKHKAGELNKAAALERARHKRGMAECRLWYLANYGKLGKVGKGRIPIVSTGCPINLAAFIPATLRNA